MNHTINHVNCPACDVLKGKASMQVSEVPAVSPLFQDAAIAWFSYKQQFIAPNTVKTYKRYLKALGRVFNQLPVSTIHIGHIKTYQIERRLKAGPDKINMEVGALVQVLKEHDHWETLKRFYKRLPSRESKIGIALTPEQEAKLFFIAKTRRQWRVAYCCALITANTSLNAAEIRHLKLAHIDLKNRLIFAHKGTKNKFREREVPLNDAAYWAIETLVKRATELAERWHVGYTTEHVLLPHRSHIRRTCPDFTRPMYGWRTAWIHLREEAGFPTLRYYDLRHTAITKLLENSDISESTVIAIAGHSTNKMLQRYSHIRREKRAEAVGKIDSFAIVRKIFPS